MAQMKESASEVANTKRSYEFLFKVFGEVRVIDFLSAYYYFTFTGSVAQPVSYLMDTGRSFPRVKWLGREADHSPPSNIEIKKTWIYTFTPPYAFMA
jgi:hypothetical protein